MQYHEAAIRTTYFAIELLRYTHHHTGHTVLTSLCTSLGYCPDRGRCSTPAQKLHVINVHRIHTTIYGDNFIACFTVSIANIKVRVRVSAKVSIKRIWYIRRLAMCHMLCILIMCIASFRLNTINEYTFNCKQGPTVKFTAYNNNNNTTT